MLIDSHAHLDMPQFDPDRADVIRRAKDAGLEMIVTIAAGNPGETSIEKSLALAETHDFIYVGIGIHPHDARLVDEAYWGKMEKWSKHPKVILWGEIGLDYYYNYSQRDTQREVFRRQLQLAQTLKLPVTIHCRDAWQDLMEILKLEWKSENLGGILHSFTGTSSQAQEAAAMGFLISFSGIVTFKNAADLKNVARTLALHHILVETDSPYLAPVPQRGKRNEPAFLVDVARSLSQIMSVPFEELQHSTTRNFRRLVGLP
jgi:TatD DNase family protein